MKLIILLAALLCNSRAFAFDNLRISIDFQNLSSKWTQVHTRFNHDLATLTEFGFASEKDPVTGNTTKIISITINGKPAKYQLSQQSLLLYSDVSFSNAVVDIVYSLPQIDKSRAVNPDGVSIVLDGKNDGILLVSGLLYLLPIPKNLTFASLIRSGSVDIKVPNGWRLWSNAGRFINLSPNHIIFFMQGFPVFQFGFYAAPDLMATPVRRSKIFKRVIHKASESPQQFLRLAEQLLPLIEKEQSKYGVFPSRRPGEFVWLGNSYRDMTSNQDTIYFSQAMFKDLFTPAEGFAHEMSHAWFGHVLALDVWSLTKGDIKDLWLSEGRAVYEGLKFFAGISTQQEYCARFNFYVMKTNYNTAITDPYFNGAMVHFYLEQLIGEKAYIDLTNQYLKLHPYEVLTTDMWLSFLSHAYPKIIDPSQIKQIIKNDSVNFWVDVLRPCPE